MDQRPACSLCLHSCDNRWVGDGTRAFCTGCLRAIGQFAANGTDRAATWPALEGGPTEKADPHGVGDARHLGERFVDLTKSLELAPRPEDAETHLDLAIAYREMGLIGDALMETAVALRHEAHLPRPRAREALSLILDRRHLRLGVAQTLVALRQALFTI